MTIYLDIDGTLIHDELTTHYGAPAAGLAEFIVALRPHNVYWLTTHCRNGDPQHARALLKPHVPEALHPDIDHIKPTVWSMQKTDGVDWEEPEFIWFDNEILSGERARFARALPTQTFIEVNLRANPEQLIEITRDVLAN